MALTFDDVPVTGKPEEQVAPTAPGPLTFDDVPFPSPGVTDYLSQAVEGAKLIPQQAEAAAIGAVQGFEGAAIPDDADERARQAGKALEEYRAKTTERLGEGFFSEMVAAVPELGYSWAMFPASIVGGEAGAAIGGVAGPVGAAIGGLAGGVAAAYPAMARAEEYRNALTWLDKENQARTGAGKEPMTLAESKAYLDQYQKQAEASGRWEAGPEAISNVIDYALLKRIPGGNILWKALKAGAGITLAELPSETITAIGQSQALQGTPTAPEKPLSFTDVGDILEAGRDVLPAVLIMSGATAGVGAGVSATVQGAGSLRERVEARRLGINREQLRTRTEMLLEEKVRNPNFDTNSPEARQFLAGALVLKDGRFAPKPAPAAPQQEVVTDEVPVREAGIEGQAQVPDVRPESQGDEGIVDLTEEVKAVAEKLVTQPDAVMTPEEVQLVQEQPEAVQAAVQEVQDEREAGGVAQEGGAGDAQGLRDQAQGGEEVDEAEAYRSDIRALVARRPDLKTGAEVSAAVFEEFGNEYAVNAAYRLGFEAVPGEIKQESRKKRNAVFAQFVPPTTPPSATPVPALQEPSAPAAVQPAPQAGPKLPAVPVDALPGVPPLKRGYKRTTFSLDAPGFNGDVFVEDTSTKGKKTLTIVRRTGQVVPASESMVEMVARHRSAGLERPAEMQFQPGWDAPAAEEVTAVEAGVKGKSASEAADWLAENAPSEDFKLIAGKVAAALRRNQDAGVTYAFNVAEAGDQAPAPLLRGARGAFLFAPTELLGHVWLNGATTGEKTGLSYRTVLHELIHAATTPNISLGERANTRLTRELDQVYNAVAEHLDDRFTSGEALTEFEELLGTRGLNVMQDTREFITAAMTLPEMQQYLEQIPFKGGGSLWSKFVRAIRTYLGLPAEADTALSEALRISEALLSSSTLITAQRSANFGFGFGTNAAGRDEINEAAGVRPQEALQTLRSTMSRYTGKPVPDGAYRLAMPPKGQAAAYAALSEYLGKLIVFVDMAATAPMTFDGVSRIVPGVLFVNAKATSPHLAVIGHEFLHELKATAPELYQEFKAAVLKTIPEGKKEAERAFLAEARRKEGQEEYDPEILEEELVAAWFGDQFLTKSFWHKLERQNPEGFARIVQQFLEFLTKIKDLLTGEQRADLERAQDVAAQAMKRYLEKNPERAGGEATFSRPFFSKVEEMVSQARQERWGSANELVNFLKGKTSEAEVAMLGLSELEGKPTKADILGKIQEAGTVFEDVVLGESEFDTDGEELYVDLLDSGMWSVFKGSEDDPVGGGYRTEEEARAALSEMTGQLPTHFATYTLPGANEGSYREMFVTAPGVKTQAPSFYVVQNPSGSWAVRQENDPEYRHSIPYDTKQEAETEIVRLTDKVYSKWQDGHSQYSSIANPVVRIRYNVRGNTLFVEEIQPPTKAEFPKMPKWLQDRAYQIGVKRIIALAKEQGYDGVSWTTAEQQNERWGTERIDWKATPAKPATKWGVQTKRSESPSAFSEPVWYNTKEEAEKKMEIWTTAGFKTAHIIDNSVEAGFIVSMQEQEGGNAGGINIEEEARRRGELLEERGATVATKEEMLALVRRNIREGVAENIADKVWQQMQETPEGTFKPRYEFFKAIYGDVKGPQNLSTLFAKYGKEKVGAVEIANDEAEYKVERTTFEGQPRYRLLKKGSQNILGVYNTAEEAWAEAERLGLLRQPFLPITAQTPDQYPMFARSLEALSEQAKGKLEDIKQVAKASLKGDNAAIAGADAYLKIMPRSILVDIYGKLVPQLKTFDEALAAQTASRNALMDKGYIVGNSLRQAAKKGAGLDKLNEAISLNSFYKMTPDVAWEDQEWVPLALRGQRNAGARKGAQNTWVKAGMPAKTGVADWFTAYTQGREAFNALDEKTQDEYNKLIKFYQTMRSKDYQLARRSIDAMTASNPALRETLVAKLDEQFVNAIQGNYTPLWRQGDYALSWTEDTGERPFMLFTSVFQRDAAKTRLEARGVTGIEMSLKENLPRSIAGVSSDLYEQLRKAAITEAEKQAVQGLDKDDIEGRDAAKRQAYVDVEGHLHALNEVFIRWLPESAAAKNLLPRKSVKGYSEDHIQALLNYTMSHAGNIAYLEHGRKVEDSILDALKDLRKRRKTEDVTLAGKVVNDMAARVEGVRTKRTGPVASFISQLTSAWYMSSPSMMFVQLSQLPILTYPNLAVEYGAAKAGAALTNGVTRAFSTKYGRDAIMENPQVQEVFDKMVSTVTAADVETGKPWAKDKQVGDLRYTDAQRSALFETVKDPYLRSLLVLRMATEMNLQDISMSYELADEVRGRSPDSPVGMAYKALLLPMTLSERASRKAAILASFELAYEKNGGNFAKAMNVVHGVVHDTLYDFAKEGKGVALMGGMANTVFKFQHFRVMTAFRLGRIVNNALRGETPETRAQARKEFIGVMGMTFLLAGVLGTPFAILFSVLDLALGDADEPVDSRLIFSNWLKEQFGETGEAFAVRGLPAALGADVSQRVGLHNIYTTQMFDAPVNAEGSDYAAWVATQILGPSFSMMQGWAQGYDDVQKGEVLRGLEGMVPKALRDVIKAGRFSVEGVKTRGGLSILQEDTIGPDELILLSLGFSPDDVAQTQQRARKVYQLSQRITQRRSELVRNLVQAVEADDADALIDARDEITAFNQRMPAFAVKGEDVRARLRSRARGEAGVEERRERQVRRQYGL